MLAECVWEYGAEEDIGTRGTRIQRTVEAAQ
jgi:hypothetical protein